VEKVTSLDRARGSVALQHNISTVVKMLMARDGYNQERLAAEIGMDQATVSARLRGLIVGLMRNSGLRCAEVAAIRPADYDPAAAELRVRGKGRRRRFVDVLDDEADLLAARLDRDPVIGLSAGRISRLVSGWMAAAGLKVEKYDGVSAHALRHTAATEYQAVCHDVRETQDFLGHANLATTDRYLAHTDRTKRRETARKAGYRRSAQAGHGVKVGLT
jgi:integrase